MTTAYMGLTLPVPGSGGTPGPTWASDLNTAITSIDSHDHTTGKGTKVPISGINWNADINLGNFSLYDVGFIRGYNNISTPTGLRLFYVKNNEFYYKNAAGVETQITDSGTVKVSGAISPTSITMDSGPWKTKISSASMAGGASGPLLSVTGTQIYGVIGMTKVSGSGWRPITTTVIADGAYFIAGADASKVYVTNGYGSTTDIYLMAFYI